MNGSQKAAAIIFAVFCVASVFIMIWDAFFMLRHRPEDTISYIVITWAKNAPLLPFMAGMLAAHLFWNLAGK